MTSTDSEMSRFRYERPDTGEGKGKKVVLLARTPHLIGAVQVVMQGGETNLHAHTHLDGVWMVLSGRARFYSDADTLFAECGKYEGVLIPRGVKYWFESASDEPLEILQFEASDVPLVSRDDLAADRIDYTPLKRAIEF
jgi:mannose-6-phosphate isomerase-like protein (cupin superfamily)